MLKYMLDTNICIFTIKNKPHEVREAFNRYHGQLCISALSLMELIYGAETSMGSSQKSIFPYFDIDTRGLMTIGPLPERRRIGPSCSPAVVESIGHRNQRPQGIASTGVRT